MNRFQFLTLLGTGVVLKPWNAAARLITSSRSIPLDQLTRSVFEKQLNTHFTLVDEKGDAIHAQLVEAGDSCWGKKVDGAERETRFSLLFHTLGSRSIEQGTYRFIHPGIGTFHLFVTPTRWQGSNHFCEVIIIR